MTRKHATARSRDRSWSRMDSVLDQTPKVPSGPDARRRLPLDRLAKLFGSFGLPLAPEQFEGAIFEPEDMVVGLHSLLSYRLHVRGVPSGPPVAVARLVPVLRLLFRTFENDAVNGESFADWSARLGQPFFTELLDDYTRVTVDDLPELLADAS